jgi:hypothetical protein
MRKAYRIYWQFKKPHPVWGSYYARSEQYSSKKDAKFLRKHSIKMPDISMIIRKEPEDRFQKEERRLLGKKKKSLLSELITPY